MSNRRVLREAVLVAVVAGVQLFGTWVTSQHQPHARELGITSTLLLVMGPLSLPLRRRDSWIPLAVCLAAAVAYFSIGFPGGPAFASLVVAVFLVRRERLAQARLARSQAAAQRRNDERLQIARELHDVLAHSTSVVAVQAGVALHLLDTHPEQVRGALEAIRDASTETMRELRAALHALRTDDGDGAGRDPQPSLSHHEGLIKSASAAGLSVDLTITGPQLPLSPEVDLAAYRILQEALTNTARHAGDSAVVVTVTYAANEVRIRVKSTGHRPAHAGGGQGSGIIGMRERAFALGGSVSIEDSTEGFVVEAVLPFVPPLPHLEPALR